MLVNRASAAASLLFALIIFHGIHQMAMAQDCPLDFSASNFTLAASACSNNETRGTCCRYINALIAISISRYANLTSNIGAPPELRETCLRSVSQSLELYGTPRNATVFCGLGTKIRVHYQCKGRKTVTQMLKSPRFGDVSSNCIMPLSVESNCKKCLNASILYLHRLVGDEANVTLSNCRDATFTTIASQVDIVSAVDTASCFFGIPGIGSMPDKSPPSLPPVISPSQFHASSPSELPSKDHRHHYRLTIIPAIGIFITSVAVLLLIVMILLIRKKSRQLEDSEVPDKTSWKAFPTRSFRKLQEGPASMFRKFSYKETKKATNNFNTIIGQGGFGTVYKAQFSDGFVVAVKWMDKVSEQAEDDFCREIELLGRLHHRHLVSLRGFCVDRRERFLMYEYMENGSLKDHLHSTGKTPLSWQTRIQIAIDVANALEYLHFYCEPPLCHRDIKSSNILLDENFVAKVADFGLAHASKTGAISIEPMNTDIRGTPGYMDPEYVVNEELTEKSDVYSYGVLLLELVSGRRAIQDGRNLVEWSQIYMADESRLPELVDPNVGESFDLEQLLTIASIIRWCTQREGRARPSIKQVLRVLYESSDPMHIGFVNDMEDGDYEGGERSKGKVHRSEVIYHSGDARYLPSSSSTSRSYCSRSFLLESGSP
ncbi:probable receptor-like protein kinase At1g49730 isoform X1 [Papaver somniferum]|uniref:probable receptor-like protein kinase At1g49730 isoform X1 n=1 Tax=Papaver somniferum TaxID=3469 RepID=UPI000E6F9C63|nr:probable receptor-like protein kinase At1g49730 isoform X1 [Papaver somniferum]